ncbi:MAG: putative superfamily drug exporter [Paenibacillus sp.]|jgi:RND superfamily putative drug exporter|nr:putative superfamily drug exporter [Paenibacillus sp.]
MQASIHDSAKKENDSGPGKEDPILRRLGRFILQWRRAVLISGILLFVLSGVLGAGAVGKLSLSRFEVPGSESVKARELLHEQFKSGSPNLILMVTAKQGTVDSPEVTEAGLALMKELAAEPLVEETASYWSRSSTPTLRSDDSRQALIIARLYGGPTEVRNALAATSPKFTRENNAVKVAVGGQEEIFRQAGEFARQDFVRAELIILPVVLLLLILLYRRFLTALLTLLIGLFSMLATLAALRGVVEFTMVSTFALNLTLVMGLGLGIDYSLFIITRFREELAKGKAVPEAVVRTVETAGKTVAFSGITVAVSLSMLLLFPFPFLRSFAYSGVLVVISGVIGSVVFLPAALALLGVRAARRPSRRSGAAANTAAASNTGMWYRIAMGVMRKPFITGGIALMILLVLGSPILGLRFGLPDDRVLPSSASSRQVQEDVRSGFASEETDTIQAVAVNIGNPAGKRAEIERYAVELSRVPGINKVDSWVGSFVNGQKTMEPDAGSERFVNPTGTWFAAIPSGKALEADVTSMVSAVRAVPAPFGVMIGGYPAELSDYRVLLLERIPLVLVLILSVTFVILFLMSGSLLIPLKATILNILSLSVMFGALVWIFQEGHLSGLLQFTATGTLEPSIPILMFCIAYGLSMDYEVFIMSRIKEEYERTGDNTQAVAAGIQRSGPLVSSAAAILAFTFATYGTGGVVYLKMLGIGMMLAVLVDATLIRAVLVPALMRLAGKANWWAPEPLRRIYERIGASEAETETTSVPRAPAQNLPQ